MAGPGDDPRGGDRRPGREPDAGRTAEARVALRRVERESETLIGGTVRRAGDHFAGRDAPTGDPIEVWGRRIGRVLSVGLAIALAGWLAFQLGWLQ